MSKDVTYAELMSISSANFLTEEFDASKFNAMGKDEIDEFIEEHKISTYENADNEFIYELIENGADYLKSFMVSKEITVVD